MGLLYMALWGEREKGTIGRKAEALKREGRRMGGESLTRAFVMAFWNKRKKTPPVKGEGTWIVGGGTNLTNDAAY